MQNLKKKENFKIDIFANLLERRGGGGYYTSSFAFLHAPLYTSLLAKRSVRYNIENFFLTLDSNCLLYLSSLFEIGIKVIIFKLFFQFAVDREKDMILKHCKISYIILSLIFEFKVVPLRIKYLI